MAEIRYSAASATAFLVTVDGVLCGRVQRIKNPGREWKATGESQAWGVWDLHGEIVMNRTFYYFPSRAKAAAALIPIKDQA